MAEIDLVEVVSQLNRRCDLGRVIVPNSFPEALRPRVTGKIYFCCNRAFLTDASLGRHRALGGCMDGSSSEDNILFCKEEQGTETRSNELSIPSTVKCHEADESSCKFENNDSTTDAEEYKVPLTCKWFVPARKKGNALQLKEERGDSPPTPDSGQGQDSIEINSFESDASNTELISLFSTSKTGRHECRECDFSAKRMSVILRHVKSSHELDTTLGKENRDEEVHEKDTGRKRVLINSNDKTSNDTPFPSKLNDFKCDLCSYTAERGCNFKWHKKNAHVENGEFPCNLCACVYRTKIGLGIHLSVFHKVPESHQKRSPWFSVQKNDTDAKECGESNKMEHLQNDARPDSIPNDKCHKPVCPKRRFSCNLCPYVTVNDQLVMRHMKGAHNQTHTNVCPHCSCRYKFRSHLLGHIKKMHHTETSDTSNSLYLVSSNRSSLVSNWIQSLNCNEPEEDNNIEVNEPANSQNMKGSDHRYICKSCSRTFTSRIQLVTHYRQKHIRKLSSRTVAKSIKPLNGQQKLLSKNDFACIPCKRNFQCAFNLKIHERACHVKEGSYPCSVKGCDCVCGTKPSLAHHLNQWHKITKCNAIAAQSNGSTPPSENDTLKKDSHEILETSTSGTSSSSSSLFIRTTNTTNPDLQVVCTICKFVANDREELYSHRKKTHVLREVECICGCSFTTATELTNHKNSDCRESKKENNGSQTESSLDLETTQLLPKRMSRSSRNLNKLESSCCGQPDVVSVPIATADTTIKRVLFPKKENQPRMRCSRCIQTFQTEIGLRRHFLKMHLETTCETCEICHYPTRNFRCYKKHKKTCHVKNGIQCPDCVCSFRGIEGLSGHAALLHKKKLDRSVLELKCNQCNFIAYLQSELDNHVQRIHIQGTPDCVKKHALLCQMCNFTTDDVRRLETHKLTNHVEGGVKCDFCNNTFNSMNALRGHLFSHKKESRQSRNPEDTICKLCNCQTGTWKNLKQHKQRCHVKDGISCPDCPCTFKDVYCLAKHMRMMHKKTLNKQNYLLRCCDCGFTTYLQANLRRHMKVSHEKLSPSVENKEKPKCHLCQMIITGTIESHMKRAHVSGGHACSDCNCIFNSSSGLSKHLFRRHGKRLIVEKIRDPVEYGIECSDCAFRCKTEQALNQHCVKVHGYSIPISGLSKLLDKRRSCKLCKAEFSGTLAAHNRYCHVENGFQCSQCCCTFETFEHRARHMHRIHKIATVKQCTLCGLKYSGTFKQHVKKSHVKNGVKCNYCLCTFESESGMVMHARKMHKTTAFPTTTVCQLCGTKLGKCHVQNGSKCTACCCSFETEVGRSSHMWRKHGIRLPLSPKKCLQCGIVPKVQMSYHLKHSHVENGIKCSRCTCSFDTERVRNLHLEKYHNVEIRLPKICPKCGIKPAVPMKYHLQHSHVENGISCSQCICTFDSEKRKNLHEQKYHDVKIPKKIPSPKKCEICDLVYSVPHYEHLKKNHVKNGYPCSYCKCSFRNKIGRRCHTNLKHKKTTPHFTSNMLVSSEYTFEEISHKQ